MINTSGSKFQIRKSVDSSLPLRQRKEEKAIGDSEYLNNSNSCDEEKPPQMTFNYEQQGQWVAVHYDCLLNWLSHDITSPFSDVIKT